MNGIIVGKLDEYFAGHKLSTFKKGSALVSLGEEPEEVFYLKEGYVRMSTVLISGNELTLNIYKPGSLFPMFWALGDVANNYAFETMTEAQVYRVPKSEVTKYLQENPDVSFDLIKRILAGVDGLLANYHHLLVGDADSRIASAILTAAKRFGGETNDGILIDLPLTHQDIANLAGVSRETSSISIEKLLKEGILGKKNRKFLVLNIDKLRKKTDMYAEDSKNDPTIL